MPHFKITNKINNNLFLLHYMNLGIKLEKSVQTPLTELSNIELYNSLITGFSPWNF